MSNLYQWQLRAFESIKDSNAIIASPTGSGKTKVAYLWAGIMDKEENTFNPKHRVIFTAPIKALSNERYLELRKIGLNVGLETGDFKKNTQASIICCTQEIYTAKYANIPNQRVIIDEFHYIATNAERARAYIDGIVNTSADSMMLVMSATFGKPAQIQQYLSRIGNREFVLFENMERITGLSFLEKPVDLKNIKNALVFVFSRKGVEELAEEIANNRNSVEKEKIQRLQELAEIFSTEVPDICTKGVGIYHGSLLPKNKLFLETAYREQLIDVMVGTDALSLGVNLPAETVVFAQLAKYYEGPISVNEFHQMAGRAGRKGYFDTGYVTYYYSRFESFDYNTEELYKDIIKAPLKPMEIDLAISVSALLKNIRSVEEEAEYVAKNSFPVKPVSEVIREIQLVLETIEEQSSSMENPMRFKEILADTYFPEYSLWTNIAIAVLFYEKEKVSMTELLETVFANESIRNSFYGLLQLKKYLNSLSRQYQKRIDGKDSIDKKIYSIDSTVYDFESRIKRVNFKK